VYKFLSRPKQTRTFFRPLSGGMILFFTALSVVSPAQIQRSDSRIFSSGLNIEMDHTTPPYAALEDAYLDAALSESSAENDLSEAPIKEALEPDKAVQPASQLATKILAEQEIGPSSTVASETIQVPLSREELLQALFLPLVTASKSANADSTVNSDGASTFGSNAVATPTTRLAPPAPVAPMAAKSFAAAKVPAPQGAPYSAAQPTHSPQSEALAQALNQQGTSRLISGTIDLAEGLALSNPSDEIEVFHEVEGEVQGEPGTVWLRDGRFKIEVENLDGVLVAQLRNAQGEVLGHGQLDLVDVPLVKVQQYRVPNVSLTIKPLRPGFSGHVMSAYSYDHKKVPVAEAPVYVQALATEVSTDTNGEFVHEELAPGSATFIEVQHSGYWSSIVFAATNTEAAVTLYPKKMLKAFAEFVRANRPDISFKATSGIIWGRVMTGGQAVAGAQVELLNTPVQTKPIYFNSLMLPDPSLTGTSSNGLYAFVPLESGAHVVQATAGGLLSEPVVSQTAPLHVTTMNIQMKASRRMRIKAFDALNVTQPLSTKLNQYGSGNVSQVGGEGSELFTYAGGANMMVLEADSGAPYTPERFVTDRKQTYLYMPMVRQDWLAKLRASSGDDISGASAVGFIQGSASYTVRLEPGCDGQVVYFDTNGELLAQASQGVPGGGFAVFGMKPGIWTALISADGGLDQPFATTFFAADPDVVSVMTHSMISHSTH
jgi:hypothetical protein